MIRPALIVPMLLAPLVCAAGEKVHSLDVRILSTMLADDDGFGE